MTAVAPRAGWREENRQDRLVRAQIERDREETRARARIAEREAAARVRLEAVASRRDARAQASAARAARLAAVAEWAAAHIVDLLFVPVIGVPALLSWTAMSSFGARLYGPPGYALPAFSEGAMWAFAAAVTITLHRHPGRPVWHLRTGIIVFAAFGAGLNYVHGLTAPPLFPGLPSSIVTGAVMALVSVAGVTAHQLVTAPRGADAAPPEALADIRVDIDAVREGLDSQVRALQDRQDSTAASLADSIRAVQETFRAETEASRAALQEPVPEPDRSPAVDRAAIVGELADQIRDAISSGGQWAPDYGALMERTGYRRSWCEKAVRDARTQAFLAPGHSARTD